jgi:23S rRNA (pseudouridine1915-N3)-methyltransferase
MRVDIIAVGRLKAGPESDLFARYAERFSGAARSLGLSGLRIQELPESQARRDTERKQDEARAVLSALGANAIVIALDETGRHLTSPDFAARIGRWRDEGRKLLQCVIGGADGLDDSVRQRADLLLAFGTLTLPHQLVRALLAEQLYRATTILSGHPYHRV